MEYDWRRLFEIFLEKTWLPALLFLLLFLSFRREFFRTIRNVKERNVGAQDIFTFATFSLPFWLFLGEDIFYNYFTEFIAGTLGVIYGFHLERTSQTQAKENELLEIKKHIVDSLLHEMQNNSEDIDKGLFTYESGDKKFALFQTMLSTASFDSVVQSGDFRLLSVEAQSSVSSFYDACKILNVCFNKVVFDLSGYVDSPLSSNVTEKAYNGLKEQKEKIIESLKSEI